MIENRGQINRRVPVPLYFQLKETILGEIRGGSYHPGDAIPTEMELSEMFDLSRTTVRQATSELVQEGWLRRVKSKGTFVSEPRVTEDFFQDWADSTDSIEAMGMKAGTEILHSGVMDASEVSKDIRDRLGVGPQEKLYRVFRKRLADDKPLVLVDSYLVYERIREVADGDFEKQRLYNILSRSEESKIVNVERDVIAATASAEDAALLDIKKGRLLLKSVSVGYNAEGRPVEYSQICYREKQIRIAARVPSEQMRQ